MEIELPEIGFTFWPVGTGDSTTIAINANTVLQVDLHHMVKSEEDDDPSYPVVDYLCETLPIVDERPYLSAFALTHPDEDHIKGFSDLLERVHIGELWFTPRVFNEYKKDLCDDAVAFKEEAERRLEVNIKNDNVASGDRLRLVGYDELLLSEGFCGFPVKLLTVPGSAICEVDGVDLTDQFQAFIHAPFKDEGGDQDRNDTSLAMQVTIGSNEQRASALLLGDLGHDSIRKIIAVSKENNNEDKLQWNVLLAPHHCSKSVMFVKNPQTDEYEFQQDIMDQLEATALEPGYIVSSSMPVPVSNEAGDNPPHAIAKEKYILIAPTDFICTHENPAEETLPVRFDAGPGGFALVDSVDVGAVGLASAVKSARGEDEPPSGKAGFG